MNTAVHFWRFYFRYCDRKNLDLSESSRLNYDACARAIKRFSQTEREVLRMYYMTSWGNYEDMKAVDKYAIEHGMKEGAAWDLIKLANYTVAVE